MDFPKLARVKSGHESTIYFDVYVDGDVIDEVDLYENYVAQFVNFVIDLLQDETDGWTEAYPGLRFQRSKTRRSGERVLIIRLATARTVDTYCPFEGEK